MLTNGRVIVLNSDYSPLNIVGDQKAIKLLIKGKAEVVEVTTRIIRNFENTVAIVLPKIIKLVNYVKALHKQIMFFSKKRILLRDRYTCAYCGKYGDTIDHIIPTSRGGKKDDYLNCITSCVSCNSRKGDKTLEEVGYSLKFKPYKPTIMDLFRVKSEKIGVNLDLSKLI